MIQEPALHPDKIAQTINEMWLANSTSEGTIIKALKQFVAIPNLSPGFVNGDEWADDMQKVVELLCTSIEQLKKEWGATCKTDDIKTTVYGDKSAPIKDEKDAGRLRTPVILVEIPAFAGYYGKTRSEDTVLLYGHMDKQPVGEGWLTGFEPRKAVIKDDKMYGRGAADDGYALFGALSAILALRAQNAPHGRCLILIESAEESGSPDFPFYLDLLKAQLGDISLIVCLDSGSGDYNRLWLTDSLRGMVNGVLEVKVLTAGVHSGASSGMVPSPFRIMRQLLSRLEDEATGEIKPEQLRFNIPSINIARAEASAALLGIGVYDSFPFVDDNVRPVSENIAELLLNRAWRPALSVTGMEGFPGIREAGNATLPFARAKLSLRLPPSLDTRKASEALKEIFEKNPPYGARVSYTSTQIGNGWAAPELAPWLAQTLEEASKTYFFGNNPAFIGEGGSIDFMGDLARRFPKAQFVVTGILGPKSNAHGPNECLHLDAARRIVMCMANVLAAHAVSFPA